MVRAVVLVILGSLTVAHQLFAYSKEEKLAPELQEQFREVAKNLRCPTCTGISVLESDAEFSVQIKDKVVEQLKSGKRRDEIMAFFIERYGPWILREPPRRGISAAAWIFPISIMSIGPFVVWLVVWRRRRETAPAGIRSVAEILAEMDYQLGELRIHEGRK